MTKSTLPPKPKRTAKDDAIDAVTKPEKPETQRLTMDIPKELHRAIKKQAIDEDIRINELAARLFSAYLDSLKKP
jgi:predicted HicB family RNase H-like nuclease